MNLGQALVQTMRHVFPELTSWLDRLPDTRDQERILYERRFLAWWGLALYLFQLGSRRQRDFDLQATGTYVLTNLNRLAGTTPTTRPVQDTLDDFLGHTKVQAIAKVRTQMGHRLLRMKVLDSARLHGKLVRLVDGTGVRCWRRHCEHCLVPRHRSGTLYLHNVLEAKRRGPAGVVVSVDSAFIENDAAQEAAGKGAEAVKQDCALKAFSRLAPRVKTAYPQLQLVLAGDSLLACGRVLQLAKDHRWS